MRGTSVIAICDVAGMGREIMVRAMLVSAHPVENRSESSRVPAVAAAARQLAAAWAGVPPDTFRCRAEGVARDAADAGAHDGALAEAAVRVLGLAARQAREVSSTQA